MCPVTTAPRIHCHGLLGLPIFEGDLQVRVRTLHLSGFGFADEKADVERKKTGTNGTNDPTR